MHCIPLVIPWCHATFHALAEHLHLLKTSCSLVLEDEGFQLPTLLAERTIKSAEWLSEAENKGAAIILPVILLLAWRVAFQLFIRHDLEDGKCGNVITSCYLSEEFVSRWAQFLQANVGTEACPIFYQFVTDSIMKVLTKEHFPLIEVACSEQKLPSLGYEEVNAP